MQLFSTIETGILIVVASLLVWAAITDIMHRRIANRIVVSVVAMFGFWIVTQLSNGADYKSVLVWPIATALVIFVVGAAMFAARLMGGGDVKLLAATALFAGPKLGLSFILYVVVAGGFVAFGTLLYGRLYSAANPAIANKVPYGVAITTGGLWVCFQQFSALFA